MSKLVLITCVVVGFIIICVRVVFKILGWCSQYGADSDRRTKGSSNNISVLFKTFFFYVSLLCLVIICYEKGVVVTAWLCCAASSATLRRHSWKEFERYHRRVWMKRGYFPARCSRTQAPTRDECEEYRANLLLLVIWYTVLAAVCICLRIIASCNRTTVPAWEATPIGDVGER